MKICDFFRNTWDGIHQKIMVERTKCVQKSDIIYCTPKGDTKAFFKLKMNCESLKNI